MPYCYRHRSSSFPSCLRPTTTRTANPNLTTSLYQTELGLFGLTWSRSLFGGRSFHILLLLRLEESADHHLSFPPSSFHLHIKPFSFWKKRGSKTLVLPNSSKIAGVYWDLSRAKFGSRPDPISGYYVAIVIGGEMALLVGDDSSKEAYYCCRTSSSSTRAEAEAATTIPKEPPPKEQEETWADKRSQVMVLRREHVYGKKNKLYSTRANIGGQERDVSIDYRLIGGDEPRLYFSIDNKRVLQVKHLKWKFRGNERIEVDGIPVQVSWDVHNWLFEDDEGTNKGGYALFMFKFEKLLNHHHHDYDFFSNSSCLNDLELQNCGFGFETKKMKKLLRSGRSSSSSSLSSASSSNSTTTVLEWASMEENELKDPSGFSLLVYAWKS